MINTESKKIQTQSLSCFGAELKCKFIGFGRHSEMFMRFYFSNSVLLFRNFLFLDLLIFVFGLSKLFEIFCRFIVFVPHDFYLQIFSRPDIVDRHGLLPAKKVQMDSNLLQFSFFLIKHTLGCSEVSFHHFFTLLNFFEFFMKFVNFSLKHDNCLRFFNAFFLKIRDTFLLNLCFHGADGLCQRFVLEGFVFYLILQVFELRILLFYGVDVNGVVVDGFLEMFDNLVGFSQFIFSFIVNLIDSVHFLLVPFVALFNFCEFMRHFCDLLCVGLTGILPFLFFCNLLTDSFFEVCGSGHRICSVSGVFDLISLFLSGKITDIRGTSVFERCFSVISFFRALKGGGLGGQKVIAFEGRVFDELIVVLGVYLDINYLLFFCFLIVIVIVEASIGTCNIIRFRAIAVFERTGFVELIAHLLCFCQN